MPIDKIFSYHEKSRWLVKKDPLYEGIKYSCRTTGKSLSNPFLAKQLFDEELGGPRLSSSVLDFLEWRIRTIQPKIILEFGSGISTICFARYMKELYIDSETVRVFSIEQDQSYAHETREALKSLDLDKCATVVYAPLCEQVIEGIETTCYSLSTEFLKDLLRENRPDFILVDGPKEGKDFRFGTLPLIMPFLAPQTHFFLDDALRDNEINVAHQWNRFANIYPEGIYLFAQGLLVGQVKSM